MAVGTTMQGMEKPKTFVKVAVSPPMKEEFEELHKSRGLTQIEAATRLVTWFMAQDEIVQQAIWGQLPKKMRAEARKMAADTIFKE